MVFDVSPKTLADDTDLADKGQGLGLALGGVDDADEGEDEDHQVKKFDTSEPEVHSDIADGWLDLYRKYRNACCEYCLPSSLR